MPWTSICDSSASVKNVLNNASAFSRRSSTSVKCLCKYLVPDRAVERSSIGQVALTFSSRKICCACHIGSDGYIAGKPSTQACAHRTCPSSCDILDTIGLHLRQCDRPWEVQTCSELLARHTVATHRDCSTLDGKLRSNDRIRFRVWTLEVLWFGQAG
jgi:hypothetical protein